MATYQLELEWHKTEKVLPEEYVDVLVICKDGTLDKTYFSNRFVDRKFVQNYLAWTYLPPKWTLKYFAESLG